MSAGIAIIIPYFGNWPVWIDFFVESCRANRAIDWVIIGDAAPPENRSPNVRHIRISFDEYKALLSEAFGTRVNVQTPYKLCDFKPALPYVHRDLIASYAFSGFGDLDVIYGDIRSFYDDRLLEEFDILSSHRDRVSGHLALMRNSEAVVTAFARTPGWKETLRSADYLNFDERHFYDFLRGKRRLLGRGREPLRCRFEESYSTPAVTDSMRWYWEGGRLTNEFYPHHPHMYLHFMSWHSSRWHGSQAHVRPGAAAPWTRLPKVVQMDWRDARKSGFMISPAGIQPIERPAYE
jgi:hypothetical protein